MPTISMKNILSTPDPQGKPDCLPNYCKFNNIKKGQNKNPSGVNTRTWRPAFLDP